MGQGPFGRVMAQQQQAAQQMAQQMAQQRTDKRSLMPSPGGPVLPQGAPGSPLHLGGSTGGRTYQQNPFAAQMAQAAALRGPQPMAQPQAPQPQMQAPQQVPMGMQQPRMGMF